MDFAVVERNAAAAIGWITILTGGAQLVAPAPLLPLLHVDPTPAAAQLFATVGMFMVLFGGAVVHALARPAAVPVVLLWSGLQKIGAALLVGWAVWGGVFAPLALAIAAFDFLSGLLFFDVRRREGLAA